MADGDAVFNNILAGASSEELQSPLPPRVWMESWTPENGCSASPDHAREHWQEMRVMELANRARQPARVAPTFDPLDPLHNMPWATVVEAASKLGYSRHSIYVWQKAPDQMPLCARRLLAFFMLAPPHIVQAVLTLTTDTRED